MIIFTLYSGEFRIKAPIAWTDEQGEAIYEKIELAVDAAMEALKNRLRELDPELQLFWTE